mgnify:CR=1 FL=1
MKSLVLVATKRGNVTDIVPIYKEKITSSACTSIEDAKRMLKEGENISVIIEMV